MHTVEAGLLHRDDVTQLGDVLAAHDEALAAALDSLPRSRELMDGGRFDRP